MGTKSKRENTNINCVIHAGRKTMAVLINTKKLKAFIWSECRRRIDKKGSCGLLRKELIDFREAIIMKIEKAEGENKM